MLKILIIGNGNIGKKHAAAIAQMSDIQIVGIVDPISSTTDTDIPLFNNLSTFFESDCQADVAAICSPNSQHAQQAIDCMQEGLHVLIEKPMALTKSDAEDVIRQSITSRKQVFCVMQLRYSPVVSWLKQLIDQDYLGHIYSVEIRCFWNRNHEYYQPNGNSNYWRGSLEHDKGPLFTQFSHFVDLLFYLLGRWKVEHVKFNNFNHQEMIEFEDSGDILFTIDKTSGVFHYTTSVYDKNYESTVTLIGSKGTVSIGGQYFNQIRYCHPESIPDLDVEALNIYNDDKLAGHKAVYQNAFDVLSQKDEITTNVVDGLKVVEMIEDVYDLREINSAE